MAEYAIDDKDGNPSEVFCLVTSLLGPQEASAGELAELYADRWTSAGILHIWRVDQAPS